MIFSLCLYVDVHITNISDYVVVSLWHYVIMSLCHYVIVSMCHYVFMSLCHYVITSLCRHVASENLPLHWRFNSMREMLLIYKSIASYLSSFATARTGRTWGTHTTLEKIRIFWGTLHYTPETFEKTTDLFLRLGLPSTLIRHDYGAFRKRSSNGRRIAL